MKLLLTLLLAVTAALSAAPPVVEIRDAETTIIDGTNQGRAVDASVNVPLARAAIHAALVDREKKFADDLATAKAAQLTAETKAAAVLAKAEAALADPAKAAELKAEIATAKLSKKGKRLAEIEAEKAKLAAEAAALK